MARELEVPAAPTSVPERIAVPSAGLPMLQFTQSYPGLRDIGDEAFDVSWSVDGGLLAASGAGKLGVWVAGNLAGPRVMECIGKGAVTPFSWSPARRNWLTTQRADGRLLSWDALNGHWVVIDKEKVSGLGYLTKISYAPDGERFATAGTDGYLRLWDRTGRRLHHNKVSSGSLVLLAWSADGQLLVAAGETGTILVSARDLKPRYRMPQHIAPTVRGISISPVNGVFAILKQLSTEIADLETGAIRYELDTQPGHRLDVKFSPDGRYLAVLSREEVCVWRCGNWAMVARAELPPSSPGAKYRFGGLAFHPALPILAVKNSSAGLIDCYRLDDNVLYSAPARAAAPR